MALRWSVKAVAHLMGSTRKEFEILRILSEFDCLIGSTLLKQELRKRGIFLNEKTLIHHFQSMETKGLLSCPIQDMGIPTPKGREELIIALTNYQLDFIATRFMSLNSLRKKL